RVVRARDVDQVYIFPINEGFPVLLHRLPAPPRREGLRLRRVSSANGLQDRLVREVKIPRRLEERVRMRPPHEAVADHPDIQLLHASLQPCASRTAIMVRRMFFQVSGFIIVSFENMQPSQQIWRIVFVSAPLSARSQYPASRATSSLP